MNIFTLAFWRSCLILKFLNVLPSRKPIDLIIGWAFSKEALIVKGVSPAKEKVVDVSLTEM
jgi:hypothetical protein